MTVKKLLIFVTSTVLISNFLSTSMVLASDDNPPDFLRNLPPWEIYEEPPQRIFAPPPVYVDVDAAGNFVTKVVKMTRSGGYEISEKVLSPSLLRKVIETRHIIFKDKEDPAQLPVESELAACPLPSTFSITLINNNDPVGNQALYDTSKPADATTQWLSYDFYTEDYRGSTSHVVNALWFKDYLYGWGGLIGDNSVSSRGCGSTALFNSQIEGFTCPDDPDWEHGCKNAVYNGPESCGNEMFDGPAYTEGGQEVPRYRMEMQTSEGHWVAYRIFEYKTLMGWVILTDWRSLDVDTEDYLPPPPPQYPNWLDYVTQGIYLGATAATDFIGTAHVNISNVNCGWF